MEIEALKDNRVHEVQLVSRVFPADKDLSVQLVLLVILVQ